MLLVVVVMFHVMEDRFVVNLEGRSVQLRPEQGFAA
jgi:hypothetical protein